MYTYLELRDLKDRQSIRKLRISAHSLRIETLKKAEVMSFCNKKMKTNNTFCVNVLYMTLKGKLCVIINTSIVNIFLSE